MAATLGGRTEATLRMVASNIVLGSKLACEFAVLGIAVPIGDLVTHKLEGVIAFLSNQLRSSFSSRSGKPVAATLTIY